MKVNFNHGGQGVALLWVLFAICFLPYPFCHIIVQGYKVKNYKPVKAIVLGGETKLHRNWRHSNSPSYEPVIKYSYTIEGKKFVSNKTLVVYELPFIDSRKWCRNVLDTHPTGTDVIAYYNPKKPESSFLIRDIIFTPYGGILIISAMVFLSCFAFFVLSCPEYWDKLDKRYSGTKWHWAMSNSNIELICKMAGLCFCYSFIGLIVWYNYTSIVVKPLYYLSNEFLIGYFSLNALPFGFLILRALKNVKSNIF